MIDTFRKLYDLLDPRERRNALLLLAMILLQGLVEAAGVASILPFMAVVTNPQLIQSNPYLAAAYNSLGFNNHVSFLIFLGIAALVVILIRIGGAAMTSYATTRYSVMRSFTLSRRLLEGYLSRPYGWFLNRHSADMGKAVLSEVEEVVNGCLMRAFDLLAQLIVASCLISLVVIAEPYVALLATLIVSAAYALIYFVLRPYLTRIGRDRFAANRQRFQITQEMLSGIKEVKIRGLEYPYLKRYTDIARRFARRKATHAMLSQMPRHFLEAVAIAGIMAIVLMLLIDARGDLSKVLPIVALYAFAGLRLLPTMQKIYANLASLRFGGVALDAIHTDLSEVKSSDLISRKRGRLTLSDRIELKNISFTYPKAQCPALVDVSLTIPAKTTIGFVGSTGAGKTTLVDIILGLLEPQLGDVRIDGNRITAENVRDWHQAIGYVPQHIFLTDDSVAANIAFGVAAHKIDMHAIEQVSRMAELHEFIVEELPQGYATKVGERGVRLSGGQRQRIAIARALYHDPDVLVLDEATSALDNLTERAVMNAIRNLAHRKTILIIAHRLSTVRACDRLFLLEHGRVKVSGTYDELIKADQTFRQMAI
jgi:ABC-type multidrug transport system fused ATPase/permease subunit